jgi:8-oxo-dGTP pyrophosphatase MutT (NUDIX family)
MSTQPEVVFHTPWFQVLAQKSAEGKQPHYSIRSLDFVVIVGLDAQERLLLVRQFRPAVGRFTLELPAGHIESGETPEEAARKELCEETGHEADTFELLAQLSPSTARFTNRMWVYFAANVRPALKPKYPRESDIEAIFHEGPIRGLLENPEFFASGVCASLFAAAAKGKIKI